MKLPIDDVIVDSTIQIRSSNHEATIQRYEDCFKNLPPVEVFDTPDGLLLADGFHRWAAATRLGHTDIEAKVQKGTRQDAQIFAVIANTKNADPLTIEERNEGIRRLRQLRPDWTVRQLAEAMSVSHSTVGYLFKIDEVKRSVPEPVNRLTDTHYREIASAEQESWKPLVRAADKRGWSRDLTAQAVRNLKDDRVPEERKEAILAGEADPVVPTSEGDFAVPVEVVSRDIGDALANDAVLALERALEALAKARLFRVDAILEDMSELRRSRLAKELQGDISFLEELRAGAQKPPKLEVVK